MRRWITLTVAGLIVIAGCTSDTSSSAPGSSAPGSVAPTPLSSVSDSSGSPGPTTSPGAVVAPPVRHPAASAPIYFVMTDRFENGDSSNDTGGIDGGPLDHGFLPEDTGFFHGGDLVGLTERLEYIRGMGMGAIWITPPFTNRPVQGGGEIANSSAGYHGYWQIDWSRVDPHLGSEADMQQFISAAHEAGLAVFFDVVVNHTGDVITYKENTAAYRSKGSAPHRSASGIEFDDAAVAGDEAFPKLAAHMSFPYTPDFVNQADAAIKKPDWLNDATMYHNRGDSTFSGESSTYGDFFGLDDLFTERPEVVEGMIDLYVDVIKRYEIDGFRVDTVKHVNDELWQAFVPAIRSAATEAGRPDFFIFGEVFSSDPIFNSHYTTALPFPALLDFRVHEALDQYVTAGVPGAVMEQAFDDDDWFTDADSNASMSVKFFGNHDIGRMGALVDQSTPGGLEDVELDLMRLGLDLLFLTRGTPVLYYGDEQGLTGRGGDKSARQTMFQAAAEEYVGQAMIGSDQSPGDDNFDPTHPLYMRVAELNRLRSEHPALTQGAQIVHAADGPIFAFSRIDRDERTEYLVVASNGPLDVPVTIRALTRGAEFVQLLGDRNVGDQTVRSGEDGEVRIAVPARSAMVFRSETPLPIPDDRVGIDLVRPTTGAEIPTPRYRIEAALFDGRYAEVTFSAEVNGGAPVVLGTDDAPPYRVYWNNADLAAGSEVILTATVIDGSGAAVTDSVAVTLGDRSVDG